MEIKELHLINFGKFSNKKIKLDNKMTIIYGENEAGKSTLFHFIIGMFYGFYKPYVKNRRLLEIHEAYKPWSGGGYNGSLLFYDEESQKDLRLERNFAQGQEEVKVIIEETGQDITDTYDMHPIFRLPDVAARHIGVSYATFINTLAIKQLGHETDENLDKELKETVVNALSTHNIDVSVNKVQDKITKELDNIGSSRRKTSSYYLLKQKIMTLESELEKAKDIHGELLSLKEDRDILAIEKQKALLSLQKIKVIQAYEEIIEKEKLVKQGKEISHSISELQDKQKELNISDEFTILEIEEAIEDYNQSLFLHKQIENAQKNMDNMELDIGQLKGEMVKPKNTIRDEDLENLTKDIYACHQLVEEQNELKRHIETLHLDIEKHTLSLELLETTKVKSNQQKKLVTFTGIVGLLVLIVSAILISMSSIFVIGVILGSAGIVTSISLYLLGKKQVEKTKHELLELTNELNKVKVLIKTQKTLSDKKDNQILKVFQQYQVEDIPSLTSVKDRWLKEVMSEASTSKIYDNQLSNLDKLRLKRKELQGGIENLVAKLSHIENKLRPITSYYQIRDIDDLKKVKSRLVDFLELTNSINNGKVRLRDILKGQSLEKASIELEKNNSDFEKALHTIKKETDISMTYLLSDEGHELLSFKPDIVELINTIDQKIAAIHSKSEALSRGHRRVSEIEEELVKEEESLELLDFNKKVYEMIGQTIETITDELQHNFAPLLNESVTNMVEFITDHKYQDIKINPQMLMRLKDPSTHQMISASQLSRGTMDLFYLALRDALATWVNGDKAVPVLLDETFAHFDDVRLQAALHLFSQSKRQVILFTCQKREVDISKTLDLITVVKL